MAASHSWEPHVDESAGHPHCPRKEWEEWSGGDHDSGDSDGDSSDCPPPSAADLFVEHMLDMVLLRKLSAKEFCVAMYHAAEAGIEQAAKFGDPPDKHRDMLRDV